jgi:hypothetical protein
MAEKGVPVSCAGCPTPAAGEVLNTQVIPKMIQRVPVDSWEPARAIDECHKEDRRDLRALREGLVSGARGR